MLQSPYTFKNNISFGPVGHDQQGISPKRLTRLAKQGLVTERSELLIQFLYELNFLTGYLVQAGFSHPQIPPGIRKLSNGKKNPYLPELHFLIRIGAIQKYAFFDELGNVLSYVYGLTQGAYRWSYERFHGPGLYQKGERAAVAAALRCPSYAGILNILSLNQFYISVIVNHDGIKDSSICFREGEPVCKIKAASGSLFLAGSFRSPGLTCQEAGAYWKRMLDSSEHRPEAVIMVVESMEAAWHLAGILDSLNLPLKPICLFSCDYTSMYLKNPLYEALGRFTGDSAQSYDVCSLVL